MSQRVGAVGRTAARALRPAQRLLGETLRARVAGSDAADRGHQIWGQPGERWFSPTDPIWRVHEDASMFPGGVAALLLQSLHPLAMAGVAGHSGYKGDPWGRLQRTSHYIAITTYGTIPHATQTIDHVAAVHERVRGKDDRGRPYRASDPHLLAWIHAAEIASFLAAHRVYGAHPLSAADADTYVAQTAVPAARLGVLDPPTSVAALDAVLAAYRPELELTPAAAETIDFLLRTPPLPGAARPGYWMLAAGGIAVLPPWARALVGTRLPVPVGRALGRAGTATVRWGLAGIDSGRRSAPPPD
ncbi:oxygenase MpaB family protein [Propioniciclava soli]|uniref:oxygenase MpaB family protein n=1 Tax=Propioniciclava soli TaxID=2775081 RepID=UPI001E34180A